VPKKRIQHDVAGLRLDYGGAGHARPIGRPGARVERADPPIWNIRRAYVTVCEAAFAGVVASMPAERMALLDPGLIDTVRRGMMISAAVARQAELERVRLMQAFIAFFNEYDLLLTPCVPIAPFVAGDGSTRPTPRPIPKGTIGHHTLGSSTQRSCRQPPVLGA
jgi:Asp-tRNA(Asn)/Glu-tRNA(Gln) amidotransferase A subunit family amidase